MDKEENLYRNSQIRHLRNEGIAPRNICIRLGLSRGVVMGVLYRAGMCDPDYDRHVGWRGKFV